MTQQSSDVTPNVHFSSKTDQWSTPQDLFDKLNAIHNFDVDVCADAENAKCRKYFTKEMDGLSKEWHGKVWCNPPYGRTIGQWIKRCYEHGNSVMLIPARTDTKWWHDYVIKGEIEFIRGRLKFGGHKNSAPFPSAIVIFNRAQGTPDTSWRPISEAPKDGTEVLLYRPLAQKTNDPVITIRKTVDRNNGCWEATIPKGCDGINFTEGYCYPTHWMPLPAAPKGGKQ